MCGECGCTNLYCAGDLGSSARHVQLMTSDAAHSATPGAATQFIKEQGFASASPIAVRTGHGPPFAYRTWRPLGDQVDAEEMQPLTPAQRFELHKSRYGDAHCERSDSTPIAGSHV